MSSNTAIVIGSTGLVGSHLVALLSDSSAFNKVVSITRRPVDYESSIVENHVIDFTRLSDYSALFAGDVFFSCLGTTAKQAGSLAAQRVVDFDFQLEAAKLAKQQGVVHYLLVSSSGANASSLSPYLKMKGELEQAVEVLNFDKTTIIQPSLLLGERPDARLAESLASRIMPSLCKLPGLTKFRPIYGADVAKKLIECVSTENTQRVLRLRLDQVFPVG